MIKAFVADKDRLRMVDDLAANKGTSRLGGSPDPTKEEEATIKSGWGSASRRARRWKRWRIPVASMSKTAPTS